MPGSIGDLIFRMMGKKDPREEIIASMMPQPDAAPAPPEQPPVPEQPPAPEVPPTVTQPPIPESLKSPPDLAQMYLKLMERSENAAQIDSGLALIAAGSAHEENRPGLMAMARQGGGMEQLGMNDLLKMREMQLGEQELARQRAQLPALAQQYNLDPATITYLDSSGQLDEVIADLANPDAEVVESADGSKKLINSRTGETIRELSAKAARETEYQTLGDGSQVLVYKDDKTEVATGKPLTNIEAAPDIQIIQDASGANVAYDKRSNRVIGTITEGDPTKGDFQVTRADGSVALMDKNGTVKRELSAPKIQREIVKSADGSNVLVEDGKVIGTITPADPTTGQQILERSDGSKALIDKNGEVIKELSPAEVLNAEDKDHLATINAERAAAGQPEMTTEEFLNTVGKKAATTEINIGEDGERYPKPAEGYDYDRTPDGKVKLYPDGPHQHVIAGSKAEQEATAAKQKADVAAAEAERAAAGAAGGETSEDVKKSIVDQDIDSAIEIIEDSEDSFLGVTGWGGLLAGIPSSDPKSARGLSGLLGTIKTSIGLNSR